MPSSLRRATVIGILLGVFLVPSLLQARTPVRGGARVSQPAVESGFFSMVWNLLTDVFERGTSIGSGGSLSAKNGGMLDPNGATNPSSSSGDTSTGDNGDNGDNGGMLDPNG
jgi:hypothetical protein